MIRSKVVQSRNLQANIKKLKASIPELVKAAVNEHALNIEARAKEIITHGPPGVTASPAVDTGQLRSSIHVEMFHNGFAARVGSDLKHALFVEAGTGPRSKMPPLEPIRQWCRRHGIPESAAYAIALSIMRRGTPAKPFLFPAFEIERRSFERRVGAYIQQIGGRLS